MVHSYTVRHAWPILLGGGLLLAGIAMATGWYIHQQQQQASQLLNESVTGIRAAEELEIRTREMRTRLNQFVVTGDRRYLQEIPEMHAETLEWLAAAEKLKVSSEDAGLTDRVRSGFEQFFERFREIERQSEDPAVGVETLKPRVSQLIDEQVTLGVLVHVHDFLDRSQHLIASTIPVDQRAADRVGFGLAALGIIGALGGLLFGYILSSWLRHSLVQLSVPVHDAAGKLSEVIGPVNLKLSGDDLTEMKDALSSMADHVGDVVARLQQSQREALRAEQLAAVGQLAAGMAHELRNPLTAMKMIVQSAMERSASPEVRGENLRVLYEQILRQENSIRCFLDYARPPRLFVQRFDLTSVLADSLNLMRAQAERQGVELQGAFDSTPSMVSGDATQIRQIVLNLIGNAIDVLAGRGTIDVAIESASREELSEALRPSAETLPPGPNWVVLRFADDGPGLPKHLGQRIFEPFVSTKETGVGLGLSICKRIVEMHGGVITARNRAEGQGAEFLVCLPVAGPVAPLVFAPTEASRKPLDAAGRPVGVLSTGS